ncbi:MAG TPA: hypothetical protein GXZ74_02485 [Tissierellia bacterium]|nr:hypothetical protein [Tissierellia bacterium]
MSQIQALTKRKSVREYHKRGLKAEALSFIEQAIRPPYAVANGDLVDIRFLENGTDVQTKLAGLAGYAGVMIEAPHYLAVFVEPTPKAYRAAGYYVEKLLFDAMEYNIGTCWIHVGQPEAAKARLGLETDKSLVALVALGEPLEENAIAKFFQRIKANKPSVYSPGGYGDFDVQYEERRSDRHATVDLVYLDTWGNSLTHDELEQRNLLEIYTLMKNAPSWGNRQPWKFIIDGHDIVLAIENNERGDVASDNLDGGIAMFYFDLAMNQRGFSGQWHPLYENNYRVPGDYTIVGKYTVE